MVFCRRVPVDIKFCLEIKQVAQMINFTSYWLLIGMNG